MSDRGEHTLSTDEEIATNRDDASIYEEPDAAERLLQVPADDEIIAGAAGLDEKDLRIFCQTGLLPRTGADRPADLIPAILHPYLGTNTFRRPWPLAVKQTPSSFRIEPLSKVIASLVDAVEDEGDAGELQKRALFRLQQRMAEASQIQESCAVDPWVEDMASELAMQADGLADRAEANAAALQSVRARLEEDALLVGYGEAGLREMLVSASVWVSDGRQRAFREDVAWLLSRLEDLIRVEKEDSKQGHTPEKLEHSVGGAYSRIIDFDSLSHLLDEAPHGAALDGARRRRIERTIGELSGLSSRLFSESRRTSFQSIDAARDALKSRVADFTALVRAKQIAQLEIENRYRPEIHDALFEAFAYESISAAERKAFPPVLVHVHAEKVGDIDAFGPVLHALGETGALRVLLTFSTIFDGQALPSPVMETARSAVARGDVFVQQSSAANADFVAEGVQLSARSRGSSLLVVYMGRDLAETGIDAFMHAALAADSRAVPAFRFDPANGAAWADRFSASENEQPAATWASDAIEVKIGDIVESRKFSTSAADLLVLDPRFSDQFLTVAPSFVSPDLVELTEYLESDEASRRNKLPFVWVRSGGEYLLHALVGPAVARAAEAVRTRWKMVQEWAGIDSSILKRGIEKSEEAAREQFEEAIAAAEAEFDQRMNETTKALAHKIVENIAASLLGMQTAGFSMPAAVQPAAPRPTAAVRSTEAAPAEAPAAPDAPAASKEDEDDLGLSLDEAYIDTPLCTSCNECTDLNGLIFGYNENKQAFVKDAAAGPYRDLVLAAEKCPVRIIHPGKPKNPSEKNLDEWIERAKPYL